MTIFYAALLFVFWIMLSGHFGPLLLGLGAASVGLAVYVARRMHILDHESFPVYHASQFPRFLIYLIREIIMSNIDVLKRILSSDKKAIRPTIKEFSLPQKSDLGRAIYANSITLTPGTVSVELTDNSVIVHGLTSDPIDGLATGEMAKAIPDSEVKS